MTKAISLKAIRGFADGLSDKVFKEKPRDPEDFRELVVRFVKNYGVLPTRNQIVAFNACILQYGETPSRSVLNKWTKAVAEFPNIVPKREQLFTSIFTRRTQILESAKSRRRRRK